MTTMNGITLCAKAPFRISFFCGGSDMESYYQEEAGFALSVCIKMYTRVVIRQSDKHQVIYEDVDNPSRLEEMRHAITRETLKYYNRGKPYSIVQMSDVTGGGSGLGASSSYAVALASLFDTDVLFNKDESVRSVANAAYEIERACGYCVGKQDQWAAITGGMNLFTFTPDQVITLWHADSFNDKSIYEGLEERLLLVDTGVKRDRSVDYLGNQSKLNVEKRGEVRRIAGMSHIALAYLKTHDFVSFGKLLHEAWLIKKNLNVVDGAFDNLYSAALCQGALGGKLLGAGGGGHMVFMFLDRETKNRAAELLSGSPFRFRNIKVYNPVKFEDNGVGTRCI